MFETHVNQAASKEKRATGAAPQEADRGWQVLSKAGDRELLANKPGGWSVPLEPLPGGRGCHSETVPRIPALRIKGPEGWWNVFELGLLLAVPRPVTWGHTTHQSPGGLAWMEDQPPSRAKSKQSPATHSPCPCRWGI